MTKALLGEIMDTERMLAALDEALPDTRVESELRALLRGCADAEACVSVEVDETFIRVPVDTTIEVVAKTFVKEVYPIAFRTGYRAQVAIGGVVGGERHTLKARCCFATLFFNQALQRFTTDFHSRAVWL